MTASNPLASLFLSKLEEQIERAEHLISLIPPERLKWSPQPDTFRVCDLLGHLLECLAGFCATLYAVNPDRLSHFAALRALPVNHCCELDEARERLDEYALCIKEGFELLTDDDLTRCLSTVFVPEGEPVMTVLLGNFEHLLNHKYQLFYYLKLLGVGVNSADLYRFR